MSRSHSIFTAFRTTLLLTCVVSATAACSTPSAEESETAATAIVGASPCSQGCPGDGQYALRVSGTGFSAHAGVTVAASAVEPNDLDPNAAATDRHVILTSKIKANGGFSLSCETALKENYQYPAYALWIDANDDGKCNAGDLAFNYANYYGWAEDIIATATPASIDPDSIGFREPVQPGWIPIPAPGAPVPTELMPWSGGTFCEYYHFPQ